MAPPSDAAVFAALHRIIDDADLNKATYPAAMGMEKTKAYARDLLGEALSALRPFDSKADPLREIARFVVERAVPINK